MNGLLQEKKEHSTILYYIARECLRVLDENCVAERLFYDRESRLGDILPKGTILDEKLVAEWVYPYPYESKHPLDDYSDAIIVPEMKKILDKLGDQRVITARLPDSDPKYSYHCNVNGLGIRVSQNPEVSAHFCCELLVGRPE